MAITVYADSALVYDSRLEDYALLGLSSTTGLNKSGTATLILPPGHPAYSKFVSRRTVVTIYERGALRFRGRALYPSDDFYKQRTITCEGERGFFQDAIIRPYLYQDTPAAIFTEALERYNEAVDDFKRFTLGSVTVTDPNDYVRLESSSAETFAAFFDKLVERCGGYITFNDDGNGGRAVNWLSEIGTQSGQAIEFGDNLLDFTQSGESPELATAVLPYGAQLEDGARVTIASLTEDGADWLQDDEAVALRGRIMATVTWDDVTEPANLLTKARQWLVEHRLAVTALQLSAADLSQMDRSIDSFRVGDRVRVTSAPHGVDDWFQLTERTRDWLDPAGGSIALGKAVTSLTGSDVAADRANGSAMERVKKEIISDYNTDIAAKVQELQTILATLIQQTEESIKLQVAETYVTEETLQAVQSTITQLSNAVEFEFMQLQTQVDTLDGDTITRFEEIRKYIRFENGDIILGEEGNSITLRLENDRVQFLDGGVTVAYITDKQLYVTAAHLLHSLRLGNFAWLPRANGNLSLVKVG